MEIDKSCIYTRITKTLVESLTAQNLLITIYADEEYPLKFSNNVEAIVNEAIASSDNILIVSSDDKKHIGNIHLVIGNEYEVGVVSDYNTALEEYLKPYENWLDKMTEQITLLEAEEIHIHESFLHTLKNNLCKKCRDMIFIHKCVHSNNCDK